MAVKKLWLELIPILRTCHAEKIFCEDKQLHCDSTVSELADLYAKYKGVLDKKYEQLTGGGNGDTKK